MPFFNWTHISISELANMPPGTSTYERNIKSISNFNRRVLSLGHQLQCLQGHCKARVQQAIIMFMEICYPRPKSDNEFTDYLWRLYSERFLWTNDQIIEEELVSLPLMFL